MASRIRGTVDFAIITIKEEEFDAVLRRFPPQFSESGLWEYNICDLPLPPRSDGAPRDPVRIATVRCLKQATNEAQSVTGYVIQDLDPRWILLVGIAGAIPASEYTLGDVVVSTRIYDLNVGAVHPDEHHYAITSDSIHEDVAPFVANLLAHKGDFEGWSSNESIGRPRPGVNLAALEDRLVGDEKWKKKVKSSILSHFGGPDRQPLFTAGPIASSDDLIKDPGVLQSWQTHARDIYAVEMESAGVHRGARRRGHSYPFLSIRGLSDVVGLQRDHAWTLYACETAAAFTRSFVRFIGERLQDQRSPRYRAGVLPESAARHLPRVEPRLLPPPATDPVLIAHHLGAREVLEEYAHRSHQSGPDGVLALLRRLELPWREPLDDAEQHLLAQGALHPGINYSSPPWVLQQLADAPVWLRSIANAIRAVARWPDSFRLQHVRQLSTTHLVRAQEAGHTRLAHSLGTLDVATCLLAAIAKNSPDSLNLNHPLGQEWALAVLLYAFLHDRYHGPLGHSLDPLAWMFHRRPAATEPEPAFRQLDKEVLAREVRHAERRRNHPLRRVVSFVIARLAQARYPVPNEATLMAKLRQLVRLGDDDPLPPEWHFLGDVVDGELDADRLDYLWRDALHLAVPTHEMGRLQEILGFPDARPVGALVSGARASPVEGRVRLIYPADAVLTIDSLLTLRFLFYLNFYEHPKKRLFDELVTRTLREVLERTGCLLEGRLIQPEIADTLRSLTDDGLFHFLQEVSARLGPHGAQVHNSVVLLTHDVLQARGWTMVWECALTEAQLLAEQNNRAVLWPLTEAVGKNIPGGWVERARAAARTVATAGRLGALDKLYEEQGLVPPPNLTWTPASPVVDFYEAFAGSFEALRRAEESLWAKLTQEPQVRGVLHDMAGLMAWDLNSELPRLIVMGLVRAQPPQVHQVWVDNGNQSPTPAEPRGPWQTMIQAEATFHTFLAIHPRLASVGPKIAQMVTDWFNQLGYLEM